VADSRPRRGSPMGTSKPQQPIALPQPLDERLDSWKEIAAYLKRDERTVRRWEAEGLPVHRKIHKKQASVFAYKAEIDSWWNSGRERLEAESPSRPEILVAETGRASRRKVVWILALGTAAIVASVFAFNVAQIRNRIFAEGVSPVRSIAVLPLENLSRDPEQEYFADGITEQLTTELAQISSLKVISHTSVVQYKGTKKLLPQIAKELGVDAVVEGAVQRSGEKVGINVQLVQAPTDRHLWATSYERDLRDVLDLEREVTHAIADEIKAKVTATEKARLASARSINGEAYEDYLKGRFLLAQFGEDEAKRAEGYFRRAIQKDPNSALAYAGLAEAYIELGQPWNGGEPPKETLPKAKAAAKKALEIDDSLREAHAALAHVIELYDWDWQGAEKEYRRALELSPNDTTAHFWYSEYLAAMGRSEEAFAQSRQAMTLDPLDTAPVEELGFHLYTARRYDEAVRLLQDAFKKEPDYVWARADLGWVYEQKRMYPEAIAEMEKALQASDRKDESALASLGKILGESGRRKEAKRILNELTERSKRGYVSPYLISLVQVGLGENDEAIASLEKGYASRDQWMMYLKVDPKMDDLRADPRFKDLLRRVGLPQ